MSDDKLGFSFIEIFAQIVGQTNGSTATECVRQMPPARRHNENDAKVNAHPPRHSERSIARLACPHLMQSDAFGFSQADRSGHRGNARDANP